MRRTAFVIVALAALAASTVESGELRKARRKIANRYIVVLKTAPAGAFEAMAVPSLAEMQAAKYGGKTRQVYRHALRGYAAEMTEAQAAQLALDPDVAFVEEDGVVSIDATQNN